ncbi:MAG: glycosyltransferase family 2 protein [Flavobacteriales bacterium]|nr:glycosyltransferase family 2 protein [Flavobacteriales bacterium]
MKLSIIIVNYNVRFFLEQCLLSVFKAVQHLDAEVFVVDNTSTDNSVDMVRKKFPQVRLIANTENVGFSRANNQAIRIAKGEYILLLNPDTVVEEDAFEKCIEFMDANPDAGGLGVKMIDGNGIFLPESKRGLPTPAVSFYKIFGLSILFPKSKRFSKYHLGYLKENEINEIEVLSGAYMWMRKSVLDEVGYLDESFFMYGEDIDLSYRITQAGYKNYYFPNTRIIHYKGESTKKGSINYVFVFYNAMIIFSKKHFAKNAKTFSFFINIAIYLRAFMALIFRFINYSKLVLTDLFLISGLLLLLNYLKPHIGYPNQIELNTEHGILNVLTVVLSFIIGLFLFKGYSKTVQLNKTFLGLLFGSGLLLGINHLFAKTHSFSNKYLTTIIVSVFALIFFSRIILNYFNKVKFKNTKRKNVLISGSLDFINTISNLRIQNNPLTKFLKIKPSDHITEDDFSNYVGKHSQLPDIAEIYNVNEVVFSAKDVSYASMIEEMDKTKSEFVDFKISLNDDLIIGSKTIEKII